MFQAIKGQTVTMGPALTSNCDVVVEKQWPCSKSFSEYLGFLFQDYFINYPYSLRYGCYVITLTKNIYQLQMFVQRCSEFLTFVGPCFVIQGVPLATEPGISLIILTPMKIF
jgi:hypothetical protein